MGDLELFALSTVERAEQLGFLDCGSYIQQVSAINSVSQEVSFYCDRVFHFQEFTAEDPEVLESFRGKKVQASCFPILSVEFVKGSDGREFGVIDSPRDRLAGRIRAKTFFPDCVEVAYSGGWTTYAQNPGELLAGHRRPPISLERAILAEVAKELKGERSARNVRTERTPGGASLSFFDERGISLSSELMAFLDRFGFAQRVFVV